MTVKRGDVLLVRLDPVQGSEQGKTRPCIVVQNDVGNTFSSTTIVAPITSSLPDKDYPTTVVINQGEGGIEHTSTILCNQIRTISVPDRVIKKLGSVSPALMKKVDEALKCSLGL